MATSTLEPNLYHLSGGNTKIVYSTTSLTGQSRFEYKHGTEAALNFVGDQEIRVIKTEFAKLVTVSIETVADAGNTTLTLLIPTITLIPTEHKTTFETKAVLMALRRMAAHPHGVGSHQHYSILDLRGTAELVDF